MAIFSLIYDLNCSRDNFRIKIKVLRKWVTANVHGQQRVHFIFGDDNVKFLIKLLLIALY